MMDDGGDQAFFDWLRRERPAAASRVIFVTGGAVEQVSIGLSCSGKHELA